MNIKFLKSRDDMSKMTSSFMIRPYNSEIKFKVKSQYLNLSAKSSKSTPTSVSFTLFLTSDSSTLIGAYQLRYTYTFYYVIFFDPSESVNFNPSYHSAFLLFQFNFLCLNFQKYIWKSRFWILFMVLREWFPYSLLFLGHQLTDLAWLKIAS